MPTTTNKGLSIQATGSNSGTWGAGSSYSLNEGAFNLLDTMLGGVTSLSLTNVNVALSQAQAQSGMLRLTGTLTGNVVISPDVGVLWVGFVFIENLTSGSYTVTITNSAGSVAIPQSRRGIFWIDTSNGPRVVAIVGSSSADPIPVGTVMLFYQAAAPTGWTVGSALTDYALRLVSGASGSGGSTSGSVSYTDMYSRTATDGFTLTTNEIPSHSHSLTNGTSVLRFTSGNLNINGGGLNNVLGYSLSVDATGGGAAHSHNIDMRVRTAAVILATKG